MSTVGYQLARKAIDYALKLYYSDIRIKDAQFVPQEKPVIFLINHSGGLIDMLMMLAKCPRIVNFWVAAFYWESPILAKICNALKLVPVTRSQEKDRKKQLYEWPLKGTGAEATFDYSIERLKQHECVALCPEGETHTQSRMAHFRTGTARMLLQAARQGMGSVLIQGCGLMYLDRGHARTPVVIEFGTPFTVQSLLDRAGIKSGEIPIITEELLEKITDVLQTEMKDVTVNAEDWPTVRAIKTAAELYQPDHVRLPLETEMEIVQRFANKYDALRQNQDVQAALDIVKAYNEQLDRMHVHDYHIKTQVTDFRPFVTHMLHLLWTTIWLLPGLIIALPMHLPVYLIMSKAWNAIRSNPGIDNRRIEGHEVKQVYPHFLPGALDLADSLKLAIAAVLVIAGYMLAGGLLWLMLGVRWCLAWFVFAPLLHQWSLEQLTAAVQCIRKFRTRLTLFAMRDKVLTLKQQRQQLQLQARALVDKFADPEISRIFPKCSF